MSCVVYALTNCHFSPEVFTTELRAKANALVQVIHYSISLVITQCSPIALAAVGWKYYVSVERVLDESERTLS